MPDEGGYTVQQAATANRVLREALGLGPDRFGPEQFVGMISDEIEQLRASGKSDAYIAQLLADEVGVELDADAIGKFYAGPEERGRPS